MRTPHAPSPGFYTAPDPQSCASGIGLVIAKSSSRYRCNMAWQNEHFGRNGLSGLGVRPFLTILEDSRFEFIGAFRVPKSHVKGWLVVSCSRYGNTKLPNPFEKMQSMAVVTCILVRLWVLLHGTTTRLQRECQSGNIFRHTATHYVCFCVLGAVGFST